jgi:hypothetical protein
MTDVLERAKKTRIPAIKDKVRVAFDLTREEHRIVYIFCSHHDLSIGKLAKVLLLDFVNKQMHETEKPRK